MTRLPLTFMYLMHFITYEPILTEPFTAIESNFVKKCLILNTFFKRNLRENKKNFHISFGVRGVHLN
ncbi:hypothetical protein BpHYR1_026964 [Brachionus plicatilis]|uniref:Uncharacterized protein n=1 Tax=Brachionus plicatilis TaxID=10195 RepID=A0A3M7QHE9_BRAPC|nr:hypothetical protein BpHYR1_026964 [Brachionus plicatilis]